MRAFTAAFLVACTAANAGEPPAWPKIDSLPLITNENASRLHLAGQLGSPRVEDLQWSFDGRRLGLRSSEGIRIYSCEPNQGAQVGVEGNLRDRPPRRRFGRNPRALSRSCAILDRARVPPEGQRDRLVRQRWLHPDLGNRRRKGPEREAGKEVNFPTPRSGSLSMKSRPGTRTTRRFRREEQIAP